MQEETFLLGIVGNQVLWCRGSQTRFDVLNGAWRGRLKDGKVYVVGETKPLCPAQILWKGFVPKQYQTEFTAAIAWIRREIDSEARSRAAEANL